MKRLIKVESKPRRVTGAYIKILLLVLLTSLCLFPQIGMAADSEVDLASDQYTIDTNLRYNPAVSGAELDSFIRGVYPNSPLVGLGKAWVDTGDKYNIDPVYLMAHAILESGWGFSWISTNKNNIYGWGAYDRDPEGMAEISGSYTENIDYVAMHIDSMYLTPGGDYYTEHGPTLRGMNVRYATSQTWATNITSIMNDFADGKTGYIYPGVFREYDAVYTDIDVPTLLNPGNIYTVVVKVKNRGQLTWGQDSSFKLGYSFSNTENHDEIMIAAPMPIDIEYRDHVILTFPITAPPEKGEYTLRFDMIVEGETRFSKEDVDTLDIPVEVRDPSPFANVSYSNIQGPGSPVYTGTEYKSQITVNNLSDSIWLGNIVSMGYRWIDMETGEVVLDNKSSGNPEAMIGAKQTADIETTIRTPSLPGRYILKEDMVRSNENWFSDEGAPATLLLVEVLPDFTASYKILGDYESMYINDTKVVDLNITNNSKMTWPQNGYVKVSYSFVDSGEHQGYKARVPMSQDVSPGENITIPVTVETPSVPGKYPLKFDLIYENISWFSEKGVPVHAVEVEVGTDFNASYGNIEIDMFSAGYTTNVMVEITNISEMNWPRDGSVKLSYSFSDMGDHEGYIARIPFLRDIKSGETVNMAVPIQSPTKPGVYNLRFDLVYNDHTWFSDHGCSLPSRAVKVLNPYGVIYDQITMFPTMSAGQTVVASVRLTNTGTFNWPSYGRIKLNYALFDNSGDKVSETLIPVTDGVNVGESVIQTIELNMPEEEGAYTLHFDLVDEGIVKFSETGIVSPVIDIDVGS